MHSEGRLPAHLEIAAIRRLAEAENGFATVIAKGQRDAGTILLVMIGRDRPAELYERMPQLDGTRCFVQTKQEDIDNKQDFSEYLMRRKHQDGDIWILEVDIADGERFVASLPR